MPKKGLACELGKGIQGIPEITDPAPSLLCFLCPSCLQLIGNNSDHNSAVQPLENSLNDTKTCSFNLIFSPNTAELAEHIKTKAKLIAWAAISGRPRPRVSSHLLSINTWDNYRELWCLLPTTPYDADLSTIPTSQEDLGLQSAP